jgi:hypothetical protein
MKTDETKGKYTTKRGGRRTAGKGRKIGAPFTMKGGQRCENYLDEKTIAVLGKMVEKKIAKNRSDAIRIAVSEFKI